MKKFIVSVIIVASMFTLGSISVYAQDATAPIAVDTPPTAETVENTSEIEQTTEAQISEVDSKAKEQTAFINGALAGALGAFAVGFCFAWLLKDSLINTRR